MSTQDNYDRERGSKKPGKNARKKSIARANAPVKKEDVSKKQPARPATPSAKLKLKFDKDGKEIGRRPRPVVESRKAIQQTEFD